MESSIKTEQGPNFCSDANATFMFSCVETVFGVKKEIQTQISDKNNKNRTHCFKCRICQKEFEVKSKLKNHLNTHSKEKKYECTSCHKRFFQEGDLQRHFEAAHKSERLYLCKVCGAMFSQHKSLKIHVRSHGKKPYQCKTCGEKFTNQMQLEDHFVVHTGVKVYRYECKTCKMPFTNILRLHKHTYYSHRTRPLKECKLCHKQVRNFSLHMMRHETYKPIECFLCGKRFSHEILRKIHLKVHSEDKPHACATCGRTFPYLSKLRNHEFTHLDEKMFKCLICEKEYYTQANLKSHLRNYHSERKHACNECGILFTSLNYLNRHKMVHSSIRPFSCDICPKRFRLKTKLNFHKRTVHKIKIPCQCQACQIGNTMHRCRQKVTRSYADRRVLTKCDICGKMLKRGSLMSHLRLHTGERPHECDKCPEHFMFRSELMAHLQKVHNENAQTCPLCFKVIVRPAALKRHMEQHKKEPESLNCSVCNKLCANKSHLTRHSKTHAPKQHKECDICHAKFVKLASLQKHLKLHKLEIQFKHSTMDEADTAYIASQKKYGYTHQCIICEKRFRTFSDLANHADIHTTKSVVNSSSVEIEREKIGLLSDLGENENLTNEKGNSSSLIETQEKQFQCKFCDRVFSSRSGRYKHMGKHNTNEKEISKDLGKPKTFQKGKDVEKRFQCDHCTKAFVTKFGLTRHIKIHEIKETNKSNPTESGSTSDNNVKGNSLERDSSEPDSGGNHLEKDNSKVLFFISEEESTRHNLEKSKSKLVSIRILNEHANLENQFKCDICDKSFSTKAGLWKHTSNKHRTREICNSAENETHSNTQLEKIRKIAKIFFCDICRVCSTSQYSLNRHMKIHDSNGIGKKTQCNATNKRSNASNKSSVSNIEPKKKDFNCQTCKRNFASSAGLRRHLKIHELAENVQTGAGKTWFSDRNGLDQHLISHVSIQDAPNSVSNVLQDMSDVKVENSS